MCRSRLYLTSLAPLFSSKLWTEKLPYMATLATSTPPWESPPQVWVGPTPQPHVPHMAHTTVGVASGGLAVVESRSHLPFEAAHTPVGVTSACGHVLQSRSRVRL